jgi:hypothetical protein
VVLLKGPQNSAVTSAESISTCAFGSEMRQNKRKSIGNNFIKMPFTDISEMKRNLSASNIQIIIYQEIIPRFNLLQEKSE